MKEGGIAQMGARVGRVYGFSGRNDFLSNRKVERRSARRKVARASVRKRDRIESVHYVHEPHLVGERVSLGVEVIRLKDGY